MSQNVGGIWVRDRARRKKITQGQVAQAIEAYWTSRGAKLDPQSPLDIAPLSLQEGKRCLGFAVLPSRDGWIAVADSERYYADHSLARHLAEALGAEVFWYVLYGATDGGVSRWFESKRKAPADNYGAVEEYLVAESFPAPFTYFDQLRETFDGRALGEMKLIALSDVSATVYDTGPEAVEEHEGEEVRAPRVKRSKGKSASAPIVRPALDANRRAPFEPFRLLYNDKLVGHDSLSLGFSCRTPVGEMAKAMESVLDAYLAAVPEGALRWTLIGAHSTTTRKLTDKSLARARALFDPKALAKAESTHFWLASDEAWPSEPATEEPEAPAFLFLCNGERSVQEKEVSWGWYRPTSYVDLQFPSDYLWQLGADRFVEFAVRVAQMLPVESGFASIALTWNPLLSMTSQRAPQLAGPVVLEHRGLDVFGDSFNLGRQCRGAHWLTFLGPDLVEKLGGRTALEASLDPEVRCVDAGDALLLRAGDEPLPDPSAKDLRLLESVARAIQPITRFECPANVFSKHTQPADHARFVYRFLGGKAPT